MGLDNVDVTSLLVMNGTLYAGTVNDGVHAYNRGSWRQVGSPYLMGGRDASEDVRSLADAGGVLYAGTAWGVYSYAVK